MLNPGGHVFHFDPDLKGGLTEYDTITCSHCQKIIPVKPGLNAVTPDLGFCRSCNKNICGPCVDKGACNPWEKQMEKLEAAHRRELLYEAAHNN